MKSPALSRVLALPRSGPGALPPRTAALATHVFDLDGRPTRLLPIQTALLAALEAAPVHAGVWGEIGAGHGKTLPSILAGGVVGATRQLLVVPASLVARTRRAVEHLRAVFPPGSVSEDLTVVSSAALSQTDAGGLLYDLMPQVLVLDEAHGFMRRSARTGRLEGYVSEYPDTRVVYLSGTMGGLDLATVAPALHLCLRDGTPGPRPSERTVLDLWASVLDHKTVPSADAIRYFAPLAAWAGTPPTQAGVKAAWKLRRTTAPGVVATSEDPVTARLVLTPWRAPTPIPAPLTAALRALSETWELPDGTELVDAVRFQAHAGTLGVGFWYDTVFTPRPQAAGAPPVDVEAWKAARANWNRELRRQVLYRPAPGLDSPANVVRALEAGAFGRGALRNAWEEWCAVRDDVRAENGRANWVYRGLVDDAVAWAFARPRAVVWYESVAVGAALRAAGLTTFGAGDPTPPRSLDHVALSVNSHGTGHELQAWDTALVLEPASGAVTWEQLLARHHRIGQAAEEVLYHVNQTLWPQRVRVHAALKGAAHWEEITTQPQRLVSAPWR